MFVTNLVLFVGLLVAGWILFAGNAEDAGKKEPEPIIRSEKPLPLHELAYLKGQMAALSEHPKTMPQFEEEWVRKVCRKAILRDASFDNAPEDQIELLIEEYYRGYAERFDEYYDDRAAREFGFNYGLRFDPALHGMLPRRTDSLLANNRERLETQYRIRDEAEWRLFCEAFDKGYVQGYRMVEEGVTADSHWDKISLFEE